MDNKIVYSSDVNLESRSELCVHGDYFPKHIIRNNGESECYSEEVYYEQENDPDRDKELVLTFNNKEVLEEIKRTEDLNNDFDNYSFVPRSYLDKTEGFIKIISYISFYKKNEVFVYRRSKGKKNYSVGVGGHINIKDMYQPYALNKSLPDHKKSTFIHNPSYTIIQSAMREALEEIEIINYDFDSFSVAESIISGHLFMDNSPNTNGIRQANAALSAIVKLPDDIVVRCKESINDSIGFVSVKDLEFNNYSDFEPWSKYVLKMNHKKIVKRPSFLSKLLFY